MKRCVFLDRDGVINENARIISASDKFIMFKNVPQAIKKLNNAGFLVIIVTSQPNISKGFLTFNELENVHEYMKVLLAKREAYVDAIYVCPHHPKKGFKGEIPELKINCNCRKPKPGMLLQAIKDFDIDVENSWMVGDSKGDIIAGQRAGVKTIFVTEGGGSGSKHEEKLAYNPDFTELNLSEAVKVILNQYKCP